MSKNNTKKLQEILLIQGEDNSGPIPSIDRLREHEDLKHRILYIPQVIDDSIVDDVSYYIIKFNMDDANIPVENRKPIKLLIDSWGGEVYPTLNVMDLINISKTPVYTICMSKAFSAGGLILLAGHKRFAFENSSFMYHEGSLGFSGDRGKAKDFLDHQDAIEAKILDYVVSRTNFTREELDKTSRKDSYYVGEELITKGVVDEIVRDLSILNW